MVLNKESDWKAVLAFVRKRTDGPVFDERCRCFDDGWLY